MPHFDLPLDQLRDYRPDVAKPADFDEFWDKTLAEVRDHPLDVQFEPVDTGLANVEVLDVTFAGYGGHPVKGWLVLPAGTSEPIPAVVQYVGYGSGRGLAHTHLMWAAAGFAHFVMDTRGQGSAATPGDTPDPVGSDPSHPGFMTRGIRDPHDYYYRRVFSDGVRAVEAVRTHPAVDASRVAVLGASQGGAIAIAVGALVDDLVAVGSDVPFLCHFRRAVGLTARPPFREIALYLKAHRDHVEEAFATLSYFDGVNFAARINAPVLFSTALEDEVCPPSTVFAAFNACPVDDKQIEVYPYNDHEGGQAFQDAVALRWFSERLRASR